VAKQQIPSEEKKNLILETIDDRKAENPVVIDLRDKVNIADFFIICTGLAVPHIRAIAEHVLEMVDDHNMPKPAVSGEEVAEWVLVDFGDVILHIMSEEARARYKLEDFWTTVQPKGALPPSPDSLPSYPLDRVLAPTAENQPPVRTMRMKTTMPKTLPTTKRSTSSKAGRSATAASGLGKHVAIVDCDTPMRRGEDSGKPPESFLLRLAVG